MCCEVLLIVDAQQIFVNNAGNKDGSLAIRLFFFQCMHIKKIFDVNLK